MQVSVHPVFNISYAAARKALDHFVKEHLIAPQDGDKEDIWAELSQSSNFTFHFEGKEEATTYARSNVFYFANDFI